MWTGRVARPEEDDLMRRYLLFAFVCLLGSSAAYAGNFGLQVDYNHFNAPEDSVFDFQNGGDFGLGARGYFGTSNLGLILSFDYYFVGQDIHDLKFYEFNGNLVLTFPTEGIRPYVGGGLGIARATFDTNFFADSETQTGKNILGGIKFGTGSINPFVEARYTWYGGDESFNNRFILTGGILF
jgi:hypothetical protein